MSVAVDLAELSERVAELGPMAFLVTVGSGDRAHVVSVTADIEGETLTAGAGRTTAANVAARPGVTMLWPARPGGDYCLIVDGLGRVDGAGADARIVVEPARAVLHRVAQAPADLPSCVTVLDRRAAVEDCTRG